MISSRLLYLALLIGRIALAYDFDWTLCDKESACFVGGGCHSALKWTATKPTASCDVTLSIRAYDASRKTLLVRLLLQGTGLSYEKGASLSVNGAQFGCVIKEEKVKVETAMDSELISSSSDGTHLYCEFIVRHKEDVLPQSAGPPVSVKYGLETPSMLYQEFRTRITNTITCDPDLIRFDNHLQGLDETMKTVSALRHAVSCGTDPLWELRIEEPRGTLVAVTSIACVEAAGKWAWKVTKRDGTSDDKAVAFSAHCVTNSCLLCKAPLPCSEAGCINPSFSPGTKSNGVATCAQLSCPSDHVFATVGNNTAARVICQALSGHRYRWMMDGAPVETVQCIAKVLTTTAAPPVARSAHDVNITIVGLCGGILAVVMIGVIVYCCVERRRRKKNGSREKMSVNLQEMHTGHAPDSDPDYSAKAQTPAAEGDTVTKSPIVSPPHVTAKKDSPKKSPGKKDKKKEEKVSKTNWMIRKAKESIGLKKKATCVTTTGKSCKTKGKSQTDQGETEEETKKSKRCSAEGDTEKQSNELAHSNRPMKKYEPDHTPYESLINYEGVGDTPIKKSLKEPKERAKNTAFKQPGTEHSAKDRTETRPSQDDKPSLEPMRYPEGSEKGSAEKDDRTQSGTEKRKN